MTPAAPSPPSVAAHRHSLANPTHLVRPYLDLDCRVQWSCDGSGGEDDPLNCDFGTATREEPS